MKDKTIEKLKLMVTEGMKAEQELERRASNSWDTAAERFQEKHNRKEKK